MEIECPNCGLENAYHNGVCYECPDCNHKWSDGHDSFGSPVMGDADSENYTKD